jgi:hypothetical protein
MRFACPRLGLALLLLAVGVRNGVAQWILTAEVGAARYWGGSVENSPPHRAFRPYRPTVIVAGLTRRTGWIDLGVRLHYAGSSLALEGSDAVVSAKGVIDVYGAAAELSVGLARLSAGGGVRLSAGPLVEVWKLADDVSRVRGGVEGGVSLELPLDGRLAAEVRGGGAVLPDSPLSADVLVEGFEPRALWRRELSLGIRYRL